MVINQIRQAIKNGDLDIFPSAIEKLTELIEEKENILENKLLLVEIYEEVRNYKDALQLIDETVDQLEKEKDWVNIFRLLVYKASINQKFGKNEIAHNLIKQGLKIYEKFTQSEKSQVNVTFALLKHTSGVLEWKSGEFEKAILSYEESIIINKEISDLKALAFNYNNLGLIMFSQGKVLEALEYYSESLELAKQINFWNGQGRVYVNQSLIYLRIGDLRNVELNCSLILELSESHQINREITAFAYRNLGLVNYYRTNYPESLKYLKIAHELLIQEDYEIGITLSFYYLILVLCKSQQYEKAEEYVKDLQVFAEKHIRPLAEQVLDLSNAMIKKGRPRLKDKMNALEIFEKVSKEPIVHIDLTIFAILSYCELLIQELYYSGNPEILELLEKTLKRLEDVGKDQFSEIIHIETILLNSKIATLKLNLQNAQKLLLSAQIGAKQSGLDNLAMTASAELDQLINNYKELSLLASERDMGIRARKVLNLLQFPDFLVKIQEGSIRERIEEKENPILFLIVNEKGIVIVSSKYDSGNEINEQLFASMLSSISLLYQEEFMTESTVQIIKLENLSVLLKRQHHLCYCYVFEGNSYFAMDRLNQLMFQLEADSTLLSYATDITSFFINDEANTLINYIDSIFTQNTSSELQN